MFHRKASTASSGRLPASSRSPSSGDVSCGTHLDQVARRESAIGAVVHLVLRSAASSTRAERVEKVVPRQSRLIAKHGKGIDRRCRFVE